ILLLLYFGLPRLFPPLPSHHDPVPFEIVEIADITNTRIKEPEPQEKPPTPPPPKPEQTKQEQQALPQPKPPEPEAETLNTMPLKKPPPPKPVEKPQNDMFAKMLKNLENNKKVEAQKSPDTKADSKSKSEESKSLAPALSTRLTISEEDAL